jgi:type I restriction enzyme R subunit
MHSSIKKAFDNYNLFGFTGTPIFAINSSSGNNPQLRTTEQAFGAKLHTYTIVDAITDKNVLPFRVDYVNTIKLPEEIKDKQISGIDKENALLATERLEKISSYILEHFSQKTKRNESYKLKDRRVSGFNSLLATASIEAAKKYYATFKELQKELPSDKQLKIGIIYSFAPNEADVDGLLPEEGFETTDLDVSSRDFLESAIKDYNAIFQTTWSTSADKFESYYKDLALKLKNREIDLVIVVNMFLTGFDATTLNTLWVDKNLRLHGLLQAFSRTNRILNSVKTYGNIVCFRDLEDNTNEAISIFGNKDAGGIVLLKPYTEYFDEYSRLVSLLRDKFSPREIPAGEEDKKEFINLYNRILRLRNILTSFDDFKGNALITDADFQDYQSTYIELYNEQKKLVDGDKESIIEDVVFEIELVKQIEINVDFILILVGDLLKSSGDQNKEIKAKIDRTINASYALRSKKDLILKFIESVNNNTNVDEHWREFIDEQKATELDEIIKQENLNPEKTRELISKSIGDGELKTSGTAISALLPAQDLFDEGNIRGNQKARVIDKLKIFFERFSAL